MYDMIPASPAHQPVMPDQSIVPFEQATFVDSEHLTLDCAVRMDLIYAGKVIGYLRFMPKGPWWSARIQYDNNTTEEALGYGRSAEEAIEKAVTDGVRRLRDVASFAAKMGTQMRKHPTRVSLGKPDREG